MTARRSLSERIKMVALYYKYGTHEMVCENWGDGNVPDERTVRNTVWRFMRTGSVADLPRVGRTRTATDEGSLAAVLASVDKIPRISAGKRAEGLNTSRTSIRRCMKMVGARGYKLRTVQELSSLDCEARKHSCDFWISRLETDPELQDHIFWSDECLIRLGDPIDVSNVRVYATSNPRAVVETQNSRLGVMLWVAISSLGLIGPFFTSNKLNAAEYLDILRDEFFPRAKNMLSGRHFWFQQDGAPAHSACIITNFLDEMVPGRWVCRFGAVKWPARSPDLTPLDFALWGYVRPLILARSPRTVEELKDAIVTVFSWITQEYCEKVCRSVKERLQSCSDNGGGHFQQ